MHTQRRDTNKIKHLPEFGIVSILILILIITRNHNFLLFISLAEIFAIGIGTSIFIIAYNSQSFSENKYFQFIGISLLFVAAFDFLHLLTFEGLEVFPNINGDVGEQIRLASRYMLAFAFIAAPFSFFNKRKFWTIYFFHAALFAILTFIVFLKNFSIFFENGPDILSFHFLNEILIIVLLIISLIINLTKQQHFLVSSQNWIKIALSGFIISEIIFSLSNATNNIGITLGHLVNFISFWAIYKGFVEEVLDKPFETFFGELQQKTQLLQNESEYRKNIQIELIHNQEKYQTFFEQTVEGIYQLEVIPPMSLSLQLEEQVNYLYEHAVMVECNPAFAKMYGLESPNSFIGMTLGDFHGDGKDENYQEVLEFVSNDYRVIGKLTIEEDVSRNERYFENNTIGIIKDGLLVRAWGKQTDITDKKLNEKQKLFDGAIQQSISEVVISLDEEQHIRSWNRAAERLYGWSAQEAIGKILDELVQTRDYHDKWFITPSVLETYEHIVKEVSQVNKSGTKLIVRSSISKIFDEQKRVIGLVVVNRDVTLEKRQSERLESRVRIAEHEKHLNEDEMVQYGLDEAVRLTGSEIGYFHFVNEDQSISLSKWTRNVLDKCPPAANSNYHLAQEGIWTECLRTGKPSVHNNHSEQKDKNKEHTEGRIEIKRHVSIPIFDRSKLVVIMGVGNKQTDYDHYDLEILQSFGNDLWG